MVQEEEEEDMEGKRNLSFIRGISCSVSMMTRKQRRDLSSWQYMRWLLGICREVIRQNINPGLYRIIVKERKT